MRRLPPKRPTSDGAGAPKALSGPARNPVQSLLRGAAIQNRIGSSRRFPKASRFHFHQTALVEVHVREFLDVLPSLPSKFDLLDAVAYLSLLLTCAEVLWPKLSKLVHAIWESCKFACRDWRAFQRELSAEVEINPNQQTHE
jgi:hypothetical protein